MYLSSFGHIIEEGYAQHAGHGNKGNIVLAGGGIVWRYARRQHAGTDDADTETVSIHPGTTRPGNTYPDNTAPADTESDADSAVEVCIIYRPKYDDWSWPKGKLEGNESVFHCAAREIQEETGIPVRLGMFLGHISYPLADEGKKAAIPASNKQRTSKKADTVPVKHVFYWAAQTAASPSAEVRPQVFGAVSGPDPHEIGGLRWVSLDTARKLLTHDEDRRLIDIFQSAASSGLLRAQTVLMIRHGKAESRKSWKGEDPMRPLTPRGAAAAYALNREIACFAPDGLFSSPWRRCMETVSSYSYEAHMPVRTLSTQTEAAFADDEEASWRDFLAVMRSCIDPHNPHNSAVCMHRPVIGGMLKRMRSLCATRRLSDELPGCSPYMPVGNMLAVTLAPGENSGSDLIIIDIQKVAPLVY
ncbi:NUDIX domain-containing protein [Scardovia wiggsiae]|uniref:NUDIX hydrolase n=1 Tax=Scardovia wiggsiae TaxID=230143 RepID=UPI00374F245B